MVTFAHRATYTDLPCCTPKAPDLLPTALHAAASPAPLFTPEHRAKANRHEHAVPMEAGVDVGADPGFNELLATQRGGD
ncbi:hypothetical protein GN956_G9085 [Arapaima gigas]